MKKAICLVLMLALSLGFSGAGTGAGAVEAENDAAPLFGRTIALGCNFREDALGSACVVKQDGSLWVWGEPWTKTKTPVNWPVKMTEDVVSLYRDYPYSTFGRPSNPRGVLVEKSDGNMFQVNIPEAWPENLSDIAISPFYGVEQYRAGMETILTRGFFMEQGELWYVEIEPFKSEEDATAFRQEMITPANLSQKTTRQIKLSEQAVDYCYWAPLHGEQKVYILKEDNTLWVWTLPAGRNGVPPQEEPTQIMSAVASFAGKASYGLQRTDGSIWRIDPKDRGEPVALLENASVFRYDAVGEDIWAAIDQDGVLWMWGSNLGSDGSFVKGTYQTSPVKVMDHVADVDLCFGVTMALKTDGTLWAWGGGSASRPDYLLPPQYLFPGDPNNQKAHPVPEQILDGVAVPGAPAHFPSSWAKEEVSLANSAGLVPDALQSWYHRNMTRAEFCALAVAFYEKATGTVITERTAFTDTNDVNVEKMAAIGVVNGTGAGVFTPDGKLTREQAATMLARLADSVGKPFDSNAPDFADNGDISDWALASVGQVQAAGIMNGTDADEFVPEGPYTREQSIVTMMRMYHAIG